MIEHTSRVLAPMNPIGWILVAVGVVGLLTSVVGILYVFLQPTAAELLADSKADLYLHDTYYVSRTVHSIWPFLLCVALSAAISVVGYMHTEHFIRRMIPTAGSSEDWQTPPADA